MLYYGDKYRKMKVPEKIFFFFYPPTSEILNQEQKNCWNWILFWFFSSSDIRFSVKGSLNQKIKKSFLTRKF